MFFIGSVCRSPFSGFVLSPLTHQKVRRSTFCMLNITSLLIFIDPQRLDIWNIPLFFFFSFAFLLLSAPNPSEKISDFVSQQSNSNVLRRDFTLRAFAVQLHLSDFNEPQEVVALVFHLFSPLDCGLFEQLLKKAVWLISEVKDWSKDQN